MKTVRANDSARILFSRLDKSNGLISDSVNGVAQDRSGNSWLATDQGLSRFDRFETENFTHNPALHHSLSSNRLTAITYDAKSNKLWIGTADAGLNCFDPETNKNKRFFEKPGGSSAKDRLKSNEITTLAISDDQFLWIGTQHGLSVLHLQSMKFRNLQGIAENAHVTTIFIHKKNAVWVGTASGELFRWETQKKNATFERIWNTGAPITSIAYDSKQGLWVGTEGQGLLRLDLTTGTAEASRLAERDISSLHADSDGHLWAGTRRGLGRLDHQTGEFILFRNDSSDRDSLAHDHITSIFEDNAKVLWITTNGGGTSRFGLNRHWFPHFRRRSDDFSENQLPHNSVWGMAKGKFETVWLGTAKGLTHFEPRTQTYEVPDLSPLFGNRNPYIYSVLETHNGDVWASTKGEGIVFLPSGIAENARVYRHAKGDSTTIGHDFVTTIFEDSQFKIWFGTNGKGLWSYDETSDSFTKTPVPPKAEGQTETGSQITSITEGANTNLWVGATDGLHLYNKENSTLTHYRDINPEAYRFENEHFTTVLYASDGTLYLGTKTGGFSRFSPETGAVQHYSNATSALPNDEILGILEQNERFIWISTQGGIALFDSAEDRFRVFDKMDGIQEQLHQGAIAKTESGVLYFGGASGFHSINPEEKLPIAPSQPALPMLTSLEHLGTKVVPTPGGILEKPLAATSEIRIPFDNRNQISFRYTSQDPYFPDRGRFRYQLVNYDAGWNIDEARSRRATYPALPPGDYKFQIQSSPDGRLWNTNIASVKLIIVPQWYKTWWARILFLITSLIASLSLVRLMVRSRIQQIERREEQFTAKRDRSEAILSRQLQSAVLLDRTTRNFRHDLRGDAIFKHPLTNLGEHFEVSRCVLRTIQKNPETGEKQLVTVAEHCADGISSLGDTTIDLSDVIASAIVNSDEPVSCEFIDSNPEFLPAKEQLRQHGVKSFLAVRTNFIDQPNGILALHQCDRTRAWSDDEIKLLRSVATQFGNAIAQRDLTLKEEKYRTELETARHNADIANAAKSEFLAKMTHELRTPLNAIIGFSQVIREDESLEERQREIVDIINHSGEHLLDVVNDILDVSKIEAGKTEINLEQFELQPLLKSVKEMLNMKAESKGIGFELNNRTALPKIIETDRSKVRQVLINLLGNGLKFTDRGAIGLTVSAEALTQGHQTDGQWRRKIRLLFEISDTGRGIAQHELPRLFEKFSQTDTGRNASEGTGLGLPIAKNFVNMLGGDIEVMSKVDFGTTFRFSIDCEEIADISHESIIAGSTPNPKNQQITGIAPGNDNVRILIAEDNPVNRLLLKKVLTKGGFQLAEAVNGRDAIEKWRDWQPHLILMDEDMPIMKGSEATIAILAESPEETAPIIISLTAYAFEQARERALAVGCKDFIAKPFKAHELYTAIAKHLDLKYTYAAGDAEAVER